MSLRPRKSSRTIIRCCSAGSAPPDSAGTQYGAYTGAVNPALANANFTTMFDQFSIPGTPFRWDERFETGNRFTTYENFCDPFPKGTKITGERLL